MLSPSAVCAFLFPEFGFFLGLPVLPGASAQASLCPVPTSAAWAADGPSCPGLRPLVPAAWLYAAHAAAPPRASRASFPALPAAGPKPHGPAARTSPARLQLAFAALPQGRRVPAALGCWSSHTGPGVLPIGACAVGFSSATGSGPCDFSEAVGPARLSKSFFGLSEEKLWGSCRQAPAQRSHRLPSGSAPHPPRLWPGPGAGVSGGVAPGSRPVLGLGWAGTVMGALLSVSWARRE